jgi:transposase-like protein
MNVRDFFDLPDDQREMLIEIHRKQKFVRHEREQIDIERRKLATRELNNQTSCEHPFATKEYKAHENEFGNLTGGGEYRYHCEDCGFRWSENK